MWMMYLDARERRRRRRRRWMWWLGSEILETFLLQGSCLLFCPWHKTKTVTSVRPVFYPNW
jgi:hypothetical protein